MFVLGHLGMGALLARPWSAGIRRRWLMLGTLLPDLLDKSLYYGLSWSTGRSGQELGLVSGTRTFGHTALFLLGLTLLAGVRKSKIFGALALGVATHLLLDQLGEAFAGSSESILETALLFPLGGFRFPVIPYAGLSDHLGSFRRTHIWMGELIGGALLAWDYWRLRHRSELLSVAEKRRR